MSVCKLRILRHYSLVNSYRCWGARVILNFNCRNKNVWVLMQVFVWIVTQLQFHLEGLLTIRGKGKCGKRSSHETEWWVDVWRLRSHRRHYVLYEAVKQKTTASASIPLTFVWWPALVTGSFKGPGNGCLSKADIYRHIIIIIIIILTHSAGQ